MLANRSSSIAVVELVCWCSVGPSATVHGTRNRARGASLSSRLLVPGPLGIASFVGTSHSLRSLAPHFAICASEVQQRVRDDHHRPSSSRRSSSHLEGQDSDRDLSAAIRSHHDIDCTRGELLLLCRVCSLTPGNAQ